MNNKIILTTKRLILREAELSDKQFIFDLLNSPKWLKYIGDRNIKTIEDAENYITEKFIQNYSNIGYGFYVMTLKETSSSIGICGFAKRDYLDSPDIGFALLTEYERKGYTYEAAYAMLKYGENELGFTHVLAITSKNNIASQKLLEKLNIKFDSYIIEPSSGEELSLYSIVTKKLVNK